jgi:hypothetical protein
VLRWRSALRAWAAKSRARKDTECCTLSFMNWATAAAFTAAFLSLVNVAYSARLTSRGTREQWRRDQERPIVARCITLSSDAVKAWHATTQAWR